MLMFIVVCHTYNVLILYILIKTNLSVIKNFWVKINLCMSCMVYKRINHACHFRFWMEQRLYWFYNEYNFFGLVTLFIV